MIPDVVKFRHLQLSFVNEKFYHISLLKTIELSLCSFKTLQSRQLEFMQVYDQFIFTEAGM